MKKIKKTKPIVLVNKQIIEQEVRKRIKKRNVGERADIYFDSIDLQILNLLNTPNPDNHKQNMREPYYTLFEVTARLNIAYKNLKPHLDKLRRLKLIEALTTINNIPVLTTPRASFNFYEDIGGYDRDNGFDIKGYTKDKQSAEEFDKVLELLEAVRTTFYQAETEKLIEEFDLRTNKTRDKLKQIQKKD